MHLRFSIACFVLLMTTSSHAARYADDHPVARTGGRTIIYREIGCAFRLDDLAGQAAREGRSYDEVCEEFEQRQLSILLRDALYRNAFVKASITVTPEDLENDLGAELSDAQLDAAVESLQRLPRLALRACEGEPLPVLYEEERIAEQSVPEPLRMSEAQFRRTLAFLGSRDAILRTLSNITPERLRQQWRDNVAFQISARKLNIWLRDEAEKHGVDDAIFAKQFWIGVIAETQTEVLEPRYRIVSFKELSWSVPRSAT